MRTHHYQITEMNAFEDVRLNYASATLEKIAGYQSLGWWQHLLDQMVHIAGQSTQCQIQALQC